MDDEAKRLGDKCEDLAQKILAATDEVTRTDRASKDALGLFEASTRRQKVEDLRTADQFLHHAQNDAKAADAAHAHGLAVEALQKLKDKRDATYEKLRAAYRSSPSAEKKSRR